MSKLGKNSAIDNIQRLRAAIDAFVTEVQHALDDGHNGNVSLTVNVHCKTIREQPEIRRVYYPRPS